MYYDICNYGIHVGTTPWYPHPYWGFPVLSSKLSYLSVCEVGLSSSKLSYLSVCEVGLVVVIKGNSDSTHFLMVARVSGCGSPTQLYFNIPVGRGLSPSPPSLI